ncbi:MAG TPA: hypothetical protein VK570_01035, partial [Rubrivivax sp.]|nr:hypothetical protein [Rubrivivax sp.]
PDVTLGHGFANDQFVTYRASDGNPGTANDALSGLVDGATYRVQVIDANRLKLNSYASLTGLVFARVANGDDTITRSSGNWADDGFAAGQSVVISGSSGNNTTLTIASVSGNVLRFAGDVLNNGTSAATLRGSVPMNPDKSTAGKDVRHVLIPQALGGLQSGLSYTVVNAAGGGFQLQRPDGTLVTAITIGDALGTHTLGKEGVNLVVGGGTNLNHQLRLDLTGSNAGGDLLLGPGGVSLRTVSPPIGDGQSSASAKGGSGGFAAIEVPTSHANFAADVQASIDADRVRSGGDVGINTLSAASVSSYANSRSGGFIQVGVVNADIDYANRNNAFVGRAAPGVVVKNIAGESAAPQIDASGVTIESAGNFRIGSHTDVITNVFASGKGGGFISVAESSADTVIDSRTNTIIGSGAAISADTVAAQARVDSVRAVARAEATAGGFAGGATARSNNTVNSDTLLLLEGTAAGLTAITSPKGADFLATHNNVSAYRNSDARWYGLFGGSSGPGDNTGSLKNLVDADPGVVVTVAPRPSAATSSAVPPSPLSTFGGFDHLALLAKANNSNLDPSNGNIKQEQRSIHWDADIVVQAGPAPELYVREDGTIDRAVNITVNGVPHPAPNSATGAQIEVGDIANNRLG